MRIFLDTNVLVSAFASRGLCADLFELILFEHELVVEIDHFVREHAGLLVGSVPAVRADVDDDDARVLGQAIAGEAEVFVTGDAVIQRLARIGEMRILSPRGFWDHLHSGS